MNMAWHSAYHCWEAPASTHLAASVTTSVFIHSPNTRHGLQKKFQISYSSDLNIIFRGKKAVSVIDVIGSVL